MAQTQAPAPAPAQSGHHHLTMADWQKLEQDPNFKELTKKKNSFIVPSTIFFLAEYLAFLVVVGYFPDFANIQLIGVNVAYLLALLQFAVTWGMIALYMNRAKGFDVIAAKVVATAGGHGYTASGSTGPAIDLAHPVKGGSND